MNVFDVTLPIHGEMPVFPGDPPARITRTNDLEQGDAMTLSHLDMGAHTGTHVDAPLHFVRGGKTIDQLDLGVLIGPASVVDLQQVRELITARDLEAAHIRPGAQRLLFKTQNGALWHKPGFQTDFVALSSDGAQWLVDHKVRLVAFDYLSADAYEAARPVAHLTLLGAGMIVVEGVMLDAVEPGDYQLICLPLKLQGAEGAPARVVLVQD